MFIDVSYLPPRCCSGLARAEELVQHAPQWTSGPQDLRTSGPQDPRNRRTSQPRGAPCRRRPLISTSPSPPGASAEGSATLGEDWCVCLCVCVSCSCSCAQEDGTQVSPDGQPWQRGEQGSREPFIADAGGGRVLPPRGPVRAPADVIEPLAHAVAAQACTSCHSHHAEERVAGRCCLGLLARPAVGLGCGRARPEWVCGLVFSPESACGSDAESAVAALSEGAAELGHSAALATELLLYLRVRKDHPDAGPSSTIDELWHWWVLAGVLGIDLISLLRQHEALSPIWVETTNPPRNAGCCSTPPSRRSCTSTWAASCTTPRSAHQIPPRAKMLRRLRSLNLMLRAGFSPSEEFWRDAGVVLSQMALLSSDGVRTGRWAYVAQEEGATAFDPEVVAFVQQRFCAPGETLEVPAPAQHGIEAPPFDRRRDPFDQLLQSKSWVELEADMKLLRADTSRGRQRQPNSFLITLESQSGRQRVFRVGRGSAISTVTRAYCEHEGIHMSELSFMFNGVRLDPGLHHTAVFG
jgi:hypothetical protein